MLALASNVVLVPSDRTHTVYTAANITDVDHVKPRQRPESCTGAVRVRFLRKTVGNRRKSTRLVKKTLEDPTVLIAMAITFIVILREQ